MMDCNIACRNIYQSALQLLLTLNVPITTFGRLLGALRPFNNLGSAITNLTSSIMALEGTPYE